MSINKSKSDILHNLTQKPNLAVGSLLGAAIGDAMGWPYEGHADRMPARDKRIKNFFAWAKKSGSRFRPYFEFIDAGEYSDDTQLLLAVARSRLKSVKWWSEFAYCELPFWTLYERGGGGATKRAAISWLSDISPWTNPKDGSLQKYLDAGGNGVAMRILPHALMNDNESFKNASVDIMTDGVVTHGHPRALVGALAYGYALWYVFRLNKTLEFGELVDVLIDCVQSWSILPSIEERWPGWAKTVNKSLNYSEIWRKTVDEMLDLLATIRAGLDGGVLASDDAVLRSIGALDSKTKGAGTVSAAVAIYFSSRYAASPLQGLQTAASLIGADTDTVASMTGGLLGALFGKGWLSDLSPYLQDGYYIEKIAADMAAGKHGVNEFISGVKRGQLNVILKSLENNQLDAYWKLPIGLNVCSSQHGNSLDQERYAVQSRSWKLITSEGMTLFVREPASLGIRRAATEVAPSVDKVIKNEENLKSIGISLTVSDLLQSRTFYEDILGLTLSGETAKTLRFENNLALKESKESFSPNRSVTLFLETTDLIRLHKSMLAINYPLIEPVLIKDKASSFECSDPDGHVIEIFQRK